MNKKTKILFIILCSIFLLGFGCQNDKPKDVGIYRSTDDGETWEQKVKIDDKNNIAQISVQEVEVDGTDKNNVLIGTTGQGVYRSTDAGDTWAHTNLGVGSINAIAINPKDNSIVYAGGSVGEIGKIYKSTDGGTNWEEIFSETQGKTMVSSIKIDWFDPRKIYASTNLGAIMKSKDSGRSWIVKKWFDDPVNNINISAEDSREIILSSGPEVYRSTDGGEKFKKTNTHYDSKDVKDIHDLVVHNKFTDILYISSQDGLYKSENSGNSWQEVNLLTKPEKRQISQIALDKEDPEVIYFCFDFNLYISKDGGKNWSVKQFTSQDVSNINVITEDVNTIYAGIILK